MKEPDVGNAMRRLPRTMASPRFTSDVIRASRSEPRSGPARRMVAAVAMALTLVVGIYAASVHRGRQQRIEELRAERQRIERELGRVKAVVDDVQPVVVLENGDTRVIVDLNDNHNANRQTRLTYH